MSTPDGNRQSAIHRLAAFFDPGHAGWLGRMVRLGLAVGALALCGLLASGLLFSRTPTGRFTLARALHSAGQYESAERVSRALVNDYPAQNPYYYTTLSRAHLAQGEVAEQLAVLDEAVTALPDNWVPHSQRCWYGAYHGHAADVLPSCDRSVALVTEGGFAHARRGFARARLGDREGAIADIEEALHRWETGRSRHASSLPWAEWLEVLKAGGDPFDEATFSPVPP